jgi:hypothetical protein
MSDDAKLTEISIPISAFESVDSITTLTREHSYLSGGHVLNWERIEWVHLIRFHRRGGSDLSFFLGHNSNEVDHFGPQIYVRKFKSLGEFFQHMPEIEDDAIRKELLIKFF